MEEERRLIIGDRTKVGIAIPQTFLDGPADAGLIGRHAARAEALGYDSLWVQHGVFSKPIDPFILMTAAAMTTSRVKIGSSVLVLPLFHPLHVARPRPALTISRAAGSFLASVWVARGTLPILQHRPGPPRPTLP